LRGIIEGAEMELRAERELEKAFDEEDKSRGG
jgi:hypothetical protein